MVCQKCEKVRYSVKKVLEDLANFVESLNTRGARPVETFVVYEKDWREQAVNGTS